MQVVDRPQPPPCGAGQPAAWFGGGVPELREVWAALAMGGGRAAPLLHLEQEGAVSPQHALSSC